MRYLAKKDLKVPWNDQLVNVTLTWDRFDNRKREGKIVLKTDTDRWVRFIWNRRRDGEWYGGPKIIASSGLKGLIDALRFIAVTVANYYANIVSENHTGSAPTEERVAYVSQGIRPGVVRHPCIKLMPNGSRFLVMPTVVNPDKLTPARLRDHDRAVSAMKGLIQPVYKKYGVQGYGTFREWLIARGIVTEWDAIVRGNY